MNKKKAFSPVRIIGTTLSISVALLTVLYTFSYLFPIPLEKIGEPPDKIAKHEGIVHYSNSKLWITDNYDYNIIRHEETFTGEIIRVINNKNHEPSISILYTKQNSYYLMAYKMVDSKTDWYKKLFDFKVDGTQYLGFQHSFERIISDHKKLPRFYTYDKDKSVVFVYDIDGNLIQKYSVSKQTKFFNISLSGRTFIDFGSGFGYYENSDYNKLKPINLYSDRFYMMPEISNPTFFDSTVQFTLVYDGKSFLLFYDINDFILKKDIKGKFTPLFDNSIFLIGEDGLYFCEITEKEGLINDFSFNRISNTKYTKDSIVKNPTYLSDSIILKEQYGDYCIFNYIWFDKDHHFLFNRDWTLQLKQTSYVAPGKYIDTIWEDGIRIIITDKGKYKFPDNSIQPYEFLYGGNNFFLYSIYQIIDKSVIGISITFIFLVAIIFMIFHVIRQKN